MGIYIWIYTNQLKKKCRVPVGLKMLFFSLFRTRTRTNSSTFGTCPSAQIRSSSLSPLPKGPLSSLRCGWWWAGDGWGRGQSPNLSIGWFNRDIQDRSAHGISRPKAMVRLLLMFFSLIPEDVGGQTISNLSLLHVQLCSLKFSSSWHQLIFRPLRSDVLQFLLSSPTLWW